MNELNTEDKKSYLIFKLGEEEYGIDISNISTIIKNVAVIARVPKTPAFVKGVINLRGEIIPVINMRKKFDLHDIEDNEETRIIIIKTEETVIGLLVDTVLEVIEIGDGSIETAAGFGGALSAERLYGIGKAGSRIISLIDLEKTISFT